MRKICIVTGSRAEYGLLYWLIKEIEADEDLELQIIATGMHLSPEFGLTYQTIEKDFKINKKVEMLISSDTAVGITKSMGLAQISFAEVYDELKPDIVVVLGDRYEIFCAVSAAFVARIPIAHIHGGELTFGAIDEQFRHAITKMSHIHFTANQIYANRVIKMGENPANVFDVGVLGVYNIHKFQLLSKYEIENKFNFKFLEKNMLITFHPQTTAPNTIGDFKIILEFLSYLENTLLIFTKCNSDENGTTINKLIDDFVNTYDNAIVFTSMGNINYLSTMQYVDCVFGNSSSGIIEAPALSIPTINIGSRQDGRIRFSSIIDTKASHNELSSAINTIYSKDFLATIKGKTNHYKNTPMMIVNTLKNINLNTITTKVFYE